MSARIVEGIFTCTKRWALENVLENVLNSALKTRRNRALKLRLPMSGIEHVLRILCWVDSLDDPSGRLYEKSARDIELAAQWDGPPGALVSALIQTGWIDETPDGMRWHDYFSMNGNAIADRVKKRRRRGDHPPGDKGDKRGDDRGDKTGDKTGDNKGDSGGDKRGASGSGSGEILTDLPALRNAAGPTAPPRLQEPEQTEPARLPPRVPRKAPPTSLVGPIFRHPPAAPHTAGDA